MEDIFGNMSISQQPQQATPFGPPSDPFQAPADPFATPQAQVNPFEQPANPFTVTTPDDAEAKAPKKKKKKKDKKKKQKEPTVDSEEEDEETEADRAEGQKWLASKKGNSLSVNSANRTRRASLMVAKPLMFIDVLPQLKRGASFLKYGASGFPHFRHFQLSGNNEHIEWFSKKKSATQTRIPVRHIMQVRLGQHGPNFKLNPAPHLAKSSFSIIYGAQRKSLDLIARDANDYNVWTKGLQKLMEMNQEGTLTEDTKSLEMEIQIQSGRRSSVMLIDTKLNLNADELAGENVDYKEFKNGKVDRKKVFKRLAKVRKEVGKIRQKAFKVQHKEQYGSIKTIVDRVTTSLDQVGEWYNTGEYAQCNDELWQCEVDLESVDQMIHVVSKSR